MTFDGGHDTDPRDHGRPVKLVAAALGVTPEVFREAFSRVRPAPAGQQPDPAQVRRNKDVLMAALAKYGVTNDRLDEVSDYYRYRRDRGEMWPTRPAKAYAVVRDGKVVKFVVGDPGSGYTAPPKVIVPGVDNATAVLTFGTDLRTNGRVTEIRTIEEEAGR